ncbi:LuxR C-terminal-related transcriptional regulator, partial [Peptoniphilus genitalis]
MTRVSIETKSEIIMKGLQNILEGYEVLDFYKDAGEGFDILIFEDKNLEKLEVDKIRLIDEKNIPLVIDYSVTTGP